MEIKAADVAKLRKMTGAGMMDCKKALVEAEGNFDRAKEIIKEKGKLVAAKRADRETSEGAAIAKISGNKAIIVALGCETDFVAKNAEFQALAEAIAESAIANFPADKDALMACTIADGRTVEAAITEQTGKTGEKHSLVAYETVEAPYVVSYMHKITGKLATIVGWVTNLDTFTVFLSFVTQNYIWIFALLMASGVGVTVASVFLSAKKPREDEEKEK